MNYGYHQHFVASDCVTENIDSNQWNRCRGNEFEQLNTIVRDKSPNHSYPFVNCSTGHNYINVFRPIDEPSAHGSSIFSCTQQTSTEVHFCNDRGCLVPEVSITEVHKKEGFSKSRRHSKMTHSVKSPKHFDTVEVTKVDDRCEMSLPNQQITNANSPHRRPLFSPINRRDQNSVTPKASNRSYKIEKRRTRPRPYPRDYKPDFKKK
jgi:hypothetical protein